MKTEIKERIEMIRRGEVPEGYKETKVGIIPLSWRDITLMHIIKFLESGVSVNSEDIPCDKNSYGILKTSCVINGKFRCWENKRIIESELNYAKLNPKKGAVIISRMNTPELVGEVGYVDKDYNNLFIPDRLWQTAFEEEIEGKWLAELLVTSRIRNEIKNIATGTSNSMKNISKDNFLSIKIEYPPYIEQQKIATILSTWDKAIELKEKLIEQKKEQKRGLMKKLLTGEVRLPGFEEEWKEVRLGSVLKERNETNFDNLELLAITSKNGVVKRTEVDIKDNSSENKSKYKRICPLDIGYNTMRMWQGVSGVSEYEGIVSPAYTILKPTEKIDSYFMGYLFKLPKIVNLFWRFSQGLVDDTLNLKYSNLKKIKVWIPADVEEQKAIGEIFKSLDHNIELMNKQLAALKLQKQGLMQLLLTGIVRVKV